MQKMKTLKNTISSVDLHRPCQWEAEKKGKRMLEALIACPKAVGKS